MGYGRKPARLTAPAPWGAGAIKHPCPVNLVAGVRFGGQDCLSRRAWRYASQANSSAPAKAIAPVINRVVFMGCAPGCRSGGWCGRSDIDPVGNAVKVYKMYTTHRELRPGRAE